MGDDLQVIDLTNVGAYATSSISDSEDFDSSCDVISGPVSSMPFQALRPRAEERAARKRARPAKSADMLRSKDTDDDPSNRNRPSLSPITNVPGSMQAIQPPQTGQQAGPLHAANRANASHDDRKIKQAEAALRVLATKEQLKHLYIKPPTIRCIGEVHGLPDLLVRVLQRKGQYPLYAHQAEACRHLFEGNNVVVATPTASGKSLVFYVPVLKAILQGSGSALFMFPLKALARDQLAKLEGYVAALREAAGLPCCQGAPEGTSPSDGTAVVNKLTKKGAAALMRARICSYDGDTPQSERPQIRKEASVVMTNPDMLHCGMLPNHAQWRPFLRKLQYIVIDEAHHYRGAFGSHFAMVIRRLLRLCKRVYGSTPQIIAATATIGNPAEHVEALTALKCVAVTKSGAPSGEKQVVMWQPPMDSDGEGGETMASPYKEAGDVMAGLMAAGLQTLAFVPARKLTEIIARFTSGALQKRSGTKPLASMVESYRAGYTADDRCKIERRLASGKLRGLVSTNALELGIDVGELDATVHIGVPGHMHELWQQAGRAGRRNSSSLAVIIATQTPLDMYYTKHPDEYFERECEEALVDINNLGLLCWHALFAAHETPLTLEDAPYFGILFRKVIDRLLTKKLCSVCPATKSFRLCQDPPATGLGIRGNPSLDSYTMLNTAAGDAFVEELDAARVDSTAHEGAIVLHRNEAFSVHRIDREAKKVYVTPCTEHSFTTAVVLHTITVKEEHSSRALGAARVSVGDIDIENQVNKYKKMNLLTQKLIFERTLPKDKYPPTVLKTKGVWITIPTDIASRIDAKALDVAEAVQGVKNLLLCKVPQMVLCDWRDIGGHAESFHRGIEAPAIFIFDQCEGGIGVAPKVFRHIDLPLMETLLRLLCECSCEKGCPSCIMGRFDDFSRTAKEATKMLLEGITCSWMNNA